MVVSTQIGRAIGRGDVNLLIAKGSDFRPLFQPGSDERRGIQKWERAVQHGTDGLLAVRLNEFYKLGEALEDFPPSDHINRHVCHHRRH